VTRKVGKASGKPYAVVTLEDLGAGIEVLFFSRTYAALSKHLVVDRVVSVLGRVNDREGAVSLIAVDMVAVDLETAPAELTPIQLTLPWGAVTRELVDGLRAALQSSPGARPVHLLVLGTTTRTLLDLPDLRVEATPALRQRLARLLGAAAVTSWPASKRTSRRVA
jgi:DNA polymerase-3 subunit alpha